MNENLKIDVYRKDNGEWVAQVFINSEFQYFRAATPSAATIKAIEYIEKLGEIDKVEIVGI